MCLVTKSLEVLALGSKTVELDHSWLTHCILSLWLSTDSTNFAPNTALEKARTVNNNWSLLPLCQNKCRYHPRSIWASEHRWTIHHLKTLNKKCNFSTDLYGIINDEVDIGCKILILLYSILVTNQKFCPCRWSFWRILSIFETVGITQTVSAFCGHGKGTRIITCASTTSVCLQTALPPLRHDEKNGISAILTLFLGGSRENTSL